MGIDARLVETHAMGSRIDRAITCAAGFAALGAVVGPILVVVGTANDWLAIDVVGQLLFAPAAAALLVTALLMCVRMYLAPILWLIGQLCR